MTMESGAGGGYITDVEYPAYFHEVQTPVWLNYICALKGSVPPSLSAGFTYCDLGCGSGYTATLLAAANPRGSFTGIDMSRAHIAKARETAAAAAVTNLEFIEADVASLPLDRLPDFDYVAMHGVYAWAGEGVRAAIIELLRRKVKLGGIVFVSYNAYPGAAVLEPARHLMLELSRDVPGDALDRAKVAIARLKAIVDSGARYFDRNADAGTTIGSILRSDPQYVAHEFFNEVWNPFYFDTVERDMAQAGLTFLGSGILRQNFVEFAVPEAARPLLAEYENRREYELVKDFLCGTIFRRDLFSRARTGGDSADPFDEMYFGSFLTKDRISRRFEFPGGAWDFTGDLFDPIIDAVSQVSLSLSDLERHPPLAGFPRAEILGALQALVIAGHIAPFASVSPTIETKNLLSSRLNGGFNRLALANLEPGKKDILLESPVAGTAVHVNYANALLLQAIAEAGLGGAVNWLAMKLQDERVRRSLPNVPFDDQFAQTAAAQVMIRTFIESNMLYFLARGILVTG